MTKKLTVLCDLDGIVANLLGAWLKLANDAHGTALEIAHIDKWEIHECTIAGHRIYELLTPELFDALDPMPGALDALKRIHDAGHHVVIVTASAKAPGTAAAKLRWIRAHLPWLDRKDVFVGHRKHLVRGDVLIDDSPTNIVEYRAAWPDAAIVTIDYPYNRDARVTLRAPSYADPAAAWRAITDFVLDLGTQTSAGVLRDSQLVAEVARVEQLRAIEQAAAESLDAHLIAAQGALRAAGHTDFGADGSLLLAIAALVKERDELRETLGRSLVQLESANEVISEAMPEEAEGDCADMADFIAQAKKLVPAGGSR